MTESVECDYPGDDTGVDEQVGKTCDGRDNVEKEILLLSQELVARRRCSVGDDGVSSEEEGLSSHQPGQPLHNQVILMLDLVADRAVPIERTEGVERELVQRGGHRGKGDTREPYDGSDLYALSAL